MTTGRQFPEIQGDFWCQGAADDCWLLAALLALPRDPARVREERAPGGGRRFRARLFAAGLETSVLLDDAFPSVAGGCSVKQTWYTAPAVKRRIVTPCRTAASMRYNT